MNSAEKTGGTTLPDFAAIKGRQQATWATGDFSRLATHIHSTAEHLVQTADLEAGWTVLDIATGSGNAALAAARLGCVTTAIDYVPALLERGRERAAAERLEIDFREGDAEALEFGEGSFDATISIFGAMFAPDHRRTAAELVRVTRRGGRIALGNWEPESFIGDMFRTVARHAPPPAGVNSPILWGTESYLRELLGDAVSEMRIQPHEFVFRFRSAAEFVAIFRRWFGPVIKAFEAVGESGATALESDLLELAARWNRNGDGEPIAMPSSYLEVVATRAG